MKKIFNLYNLGLMFTLVITSILVFRVVNVYATVTWNSSVNSITISRSVTSAPAAVTNTFTYTVAAVSGNPAGATGAPTSASIAMSGQALSNNTATKTTTLSFANMAFARPGDYSYTITETGSTNTTLYPKDTTSYTAFISVRNVMDSNNVPTGNYTATLQLKKGSTKVTPLTAAFTSAVPSSQYSHLEVSKTVTGNMADTTDYFPVTVTLTNSGGSNLTTAYTITGLTSGVTCSGVTTQPTQTSTSGPTTFCIKHGQTAVIGKSGSVDAIPVGSKFTVAETASGYTAKYKVNTGSVTSGSSVSNQAFVAGTNTVAFTNDKNNDVPTGVIISIIPYVILIAISVGGVLAYTNLKRKKVEVTEK